MSSPRGLGVPARVGLLAILVIGALAYDREAYEPFGPPKLLVVGMGALFVLAAEAFRRAKVGTSVPTSWLVVLALPVFGSFAALLSGWPTRSGEALALEVVVAAPIVLLAWWGGTGLPSARRWLDALGLCGVMVAIIGLAQIEPSSGPAGAYDSWGFSTQPDFARFGGLGPIFESIHSGLGALASSEAAARLAGPFSWVIGPLLSFIGPIRPFAMLPRNDGPASVFGHPNVASEVVVAAVVALALSTIGHALAAEGLLRWPKRVVGVGLRLIGCVVMAAYLVATGTRGPWVALAVVGLLVVVAAIFRSPHGRRAATAVAAVGSVIAFVGLALWADSMLPGTSRGGGPREPLLTRVRLAISGDDPRRDTIAERLALWDNSRAIVRKPGSALDRVMLAAVGTGPSTWSKEYPAVQAAVVRHAAGTYSLSRRPDHAHQDPLEWVIERGMVGAVLIAALVGVALTRLISTIRLGGAGDAWSAMGILGSASALLAVSWFSFPFHGAIPVVWISVFLGLSLALPRCEFLRVDLASIIAGCVLAGFALLLKAPWAAVPCLVVPWAVSVAAQQWLKSAHRISLVVLIPAIVMPSILVAVWWDLRPVEAAAVAVAPLLGLLMVGLRRPSFELSGPVLRGVGWIAVIGALLFGLHSHGRLRASRLHLTGVGWSRAITSDPRVRDDALPRSIGALSEATLRDVSLIPASLERAQSLAALGLLADAETEGLRAVSLDPGSGNAEVFLSNLLFAEGVDRGADAIAHARRAIALVPDAAEPYLVLGRILLRDGLDDRALTCFELAIARSPNGWQPFGKVAAAAVLLARRSRPDDGLRAIAYLESAEAEASRDPVLTAWIASLYEDPSLPQQFLTKAAVLWDRVAALEPSNSDARVRRVVGYLAIDPESAVTPSRLIEIVTRLGEWIPELPDRLQVRARYYMAIANRRLGRTADAARGFADVVRLAALSPFRSAADAPFLNAALDEANRLHANPQTGR